MVFSFKNPTLKNLAEVGKRVTRTAIGITGNGKNRKEGRKRERKEERPPPENDLDKI